MWTGLSANAILFRDLKQRLTLLVGCHLALAVVATIAVIFAGPPYAAAKYAMIEVVIALYGIYLLHGVRRAACWTRIPLQLFCLISLPNWPLSFFAVGVLWLLWSSKPPRLLTRDFPTDGTRMVTNRAPLVDWRYLLLATFLYLAAWAFVHAPPWSPRM